MYIIIISIAAGIIKDMFTVNNVSVLTLDNALYDMNTVSYYVYVQLP